MAAQMVFTKAEETLLTGQDLLAMGDTGRCELVEGRLVKMSPTKFEHGRLESRFDWILRTFVEEHDLGEVMVGEVGIYIRRDPDTIRAADVLFISQERLAQATPNDFLDVAPELVIEIMSSFERWAEVRRKLRDYFSIGVQVVLVVELEEQVVTLFRSPTELEELAPADTLTLPDILPGFSCPIADFLK